MEPQFKMQFYI